MGVGRSSVLPKAVVPANLTNTLTTPLGSVVILKESFPARMGAETTVIETTVKKTKK